MNRGESQDSTGVIANPAALAGNFNNSNNNNNGDSGGAGGPNSRKGFSQDQMTLFSSFGSSRVDGVRGDANNGVSSTRDTGEKEGIMSSTPDKPGSSAVSWSASTINNSSSESSNKNLTRSNSNSERHSVVVVTTTDESAETSVNHRRTSGGQSLFRKAFHQSSNDVILESQHDNDSGKPPLGRNKVHKSTDGLNQGGGNGRKGKKEGKRLKPFKGLDLSDLTKLNHTTGGTITIHNNKAPPRMSKGGGGGGGKGAPPATHYHLQPPRIQDGQKMISIKASSQPECKRDSTTTSSQSTSQESDELLSLEDFLGGIGGGGGGGGGSNITHHHSPSAHSRQGKSPPPPSNTSSRSDGDDWLEYGSV